MVFGDRYTRLAHLLCRVSGLLAIPLALALPGCRSAKLVALTPEEVAEHGTVEIAAPRLAVFEACLQALLDEGYRIDIAEPGVGVVVTWPVRIKPDHGLAPGEARFRAYVVLVHAAPNGKARVEAIPSPAEAGESASMQRSTAAAWDADLERAAWSRLFADVRSRLLDRPSAAR